MSNENSGGKWLNDSFHYSPIPKDPSQRIYIQDTNHNVNMNKESTLLNGLELEQDENSTKMELEIEKHRVHSPHYVSRLEDRVFTLEKERLEESSYNTTDRQTKRQRLEIESIAVSKCQELENQVKILEIQLKQNTERHLIEIQEYHSQLNIVRRQLKFLQQEEESTREELKELMKTSTNEIFQLKKKLTEYESQLKFTETHLMEWKEKAMDATSQLRLVTKQSNLKIQLLEKQIEAQQELMQTTVSSETSILETKIRHLESELNQSHEDLNVSKREMEQAKEIIATSASIMDLKETIQSMEISERKLKSELIALIQSSQNTSVLQEKLHHLQVQNQSLEAKVSLLEEKNTKYLTLEKAHQEMVDTFTPIITTMETNVKLEQLHTQPAIAILKLYNARENAFELLVEQKAAVELQKKRIETQISKLQSDCMTAKNHAIKYETQVDGLKHELNTVQSIANHLTKANEELVGILESYDKEKEMNPSIPDLQIATQLKETLQQGTMLLATMENTSTRHEEYTKKLQAMEVQLEFEKAEKIKLEKHLEKVESDLAILEKRLGRGEFNVETTKIVHLAVNPTYEMLQLHHKKNEAQNVKELMEENERLRKRIETFTGEIDTTSSKLTTTTSYETIEGLKLLNQRLKEVFRVQSQQYREVVYQLTGYKFDLKKENGVDVVRVRSMYADHENDELLIRSHPDGTLDLVETAFTAQIHHSVFAYLTACRSYPAFLATLTLRLFETKTFQG